MKKTILRKTMALCLGVTLSLGSVNLIGTNALEITGFGYSMYGSGTLLIRDIEDDLKTLTIPSEITEGVVTDVIFPYNLKNVEEILVDENNPYLCSEGGVLFNKDKTILIKYPPKKSDYEYEVPGSVCIIKEKAFENVVELSELKMSSLVTELKDDVFSSCENLNYIMNTESITSIGDRTFSGCKELDGLDVTDNVKLIGEEAFRDCSDLFSFSFTNNLKYIGNEAFAGCDSLDNVYLSNCNGLDLGYGAFMNCGSLESIELPELPFIPGGTFEGCDNLKNITFPQNYAPVFIGSSAFDGCSSLASISLADGLIAIYDRAFESCTNLSSVTIPESVLYIGENAFNDCQYLETLSLPKNIKKIEFNAINTEEIYGYAGTVAETYAKDSNIRFIPIVEETEFKIGDVDGNGKVTILDLVKLKRYILTGTMEDDFLNLDVNNDQNINSIDLVSMVNILIENN